VVRAPNSILEEKRWRTSNALHKGPGFPGEEKETLAFRKDNFTTRQSVRTALPPPMERVSVGLEAPRQPESLKEGPGVPVDADERHSPHRNPTDRQ
jgi:hypothetical protein